MTTLDTTIATAIASVFERIAKDLRDSAGIKLASLGEAEGCHDVAAKPTRRTKTMTNSTLLTARQVGELLGVDARTVRRLWRAGQIPGAIQIGKSVRWRRRDIDQFVEEQVAR